MIMMLGFHHAGLLALSFRKHDSGYSHCNNILIHAPRPQSCLSLRKHGGVARSNKLLIRRRLSGNDDGDDINADDGEETTNRDNDDKGGYTWEELQADPELRQLEFDSSIDRKNTMLLPQRISQAVTALAWLFVASGFILNALGYAWVQDPTGGIRVGTLDESNFQREVMREGRRTHDDDEKKTPTSISQTETGNKYFFRWIEEQQDSQPV